MSSAISNSTISLGQILIRNESALNGVTKIQYCDLGRLRVLCTTSRRRGKEPATCNPCNLRTDSLVETSMRYLAIIAFFSGLFHKNNPLTFAQFFDEMRQEFLAHSPTVSAKNSLRFHSSKKWWDSLSLSVSDLEK